MPRVREPRFRIEVLDRKTGWEAKVYDHEDHGTDLMYAGVRGGPLEYVLAQAAHYVLVASSDAPLRDGRADR